jgi:putative tricarboxylic transport membrane protein
MVNYFHRDTIAGLFFTVISLLLLFVLIPYQIETSEGGPIALSPRLFCEISGYLLFFLSVMLTFSSICNVSKDKKTKEDVFINTDILIRGGVAVLVSFIYVLIMPKLGYFISTAMTMIFFLCFFGVRNIKGFTFFLLIILPFIYVLFVLGLKVILPSGVFF